MANKTGDVKSITLEGDIDMAGKTWIPVDLQADTKLHSLELIDGNGYTISNLTVNGQAMFTRFAGTAKLLTIKNLTFDHATVNSTRLNTSILAVQIYQNVLLENVDIKNSSITGTYKVAPYIATVYDERESNKITLTMIDCDVSDTTVTATQYAFFVAGMVSFVYEGDNDEVVFENCTVTNVTLCGPNDYNYFGFVYCNDDDSELLFDAVDGVTVTDCQKVIG